MQVCLTNRCMHKSSFGYIYIYMYRSIYICIHLLACVVIYTACRVARLLALTHSSTAASCSSWKLSGALPSHHRPRASRCTTHATGSARRAWSPPGAHPSTHPPPHPSTMHRPGDRHERIYAKECFVIGWIYRGFCPISSCCVFVLLYRS